MSKKILSALLALVLLISLVPAAAIPASAVEYTAGANMTATYKDGTLTFKGSGKIDGATTDPMTELAWYAHHNDVHTVVFPKGLTTIGNKIFSKADFPNLSNVVVESLNGWAQVTTLQHNPLTVAGNLWLQNGKNRTQVKNLKIDQATTIRSGIFAGAVLDNVLIGGKVTAVEKDAFANCVGLQTVQITSTVTMGEGAFRDNPGLHTAALNKDMSEVPSSAFKNCYALKKLTLPANATSVAPDAFANCYSLESVVMPAKLTDVGSGAFAGCNKLGSVYVPNLKGWMAASIDGSAFPQPHKMYYLENGAYKELTNLTVPADVGAISGSAFKNCTSLTEVHMSTTLGSIGADAFAGCDNIQKVYFGDVSQRDKFKSLFPATAKLFPEGNTSKDYCGDHLTWKIEGSTMYISGTGNIISNAGWSDAAFAADRANVARVVIPANVTDILVPATAFDSTMFPNLTRFETESLKSWAQTNFGSLELLNGRNLVYKNQDVVNLEIPSGTTQISANAFKGGKFQKVVIPDTVTSIGANAFAGCTDLVDVTLPNSVTSIGEGAFSGTGIKHINIPNKLTSLNNNVFKNCASLKEVIMPSSVQSVAANTFDGCTGLQRVDITDLKAWLGIDFQGTNPLTQAKKLYLNGAEAKDLVIPDGVTVIKKNAFNGCTSIESVTIPDSVLSIEAGAFNNCSNIANVTVKKSVWDRLNAGKIGVNNGYLIGASMTYLPETDNKLPEDEFPETGPRYPVSDKLVYFMTQMIECKTEAYPLYKGSDIYRIGYGTPSKKGDKITTAKALELLQDYLKRAAGAVHADSALTAKYGSELDALAAFTFLNGKGWLGGSELKTAVTSGSANDVINAFVRQNRDGSKGGMQMALCLGNMYVNGKYETAIPSNYCYVVLDPNGGKAGPGGTIQVYNLDDMNQSATQGNLLIREDMTPSWHDNEMTFMGWYTHPTDGELVTKLDATTRGLTLYAHWQSKDAGVDGETIVGKKVDYRIPALLVTDAMHLDGDGDGVPDKTERIRIFANPLKDADFEDLKTVKHINLINATSVMHVVAEYRYPGTSHLWVQLKDSGWVDLGEKTNLVITTGTIKQDPKKIVNVLAGDLKTVIGSLRNGDKISVGRRTTDAKGLVWGETVYFDSNNNKWAYGWIDLSYMVKDGTVDPNRPVKELKATGVVANTDKVNYRNAPGMVGTKILGKLPEGTKLNIYDYDFIFGHTWAECDQGWICMDYINETKVQPKPSEGSDSSTSGNVGDRENREILASGYVLNNLTLAVRNGPGNSYPKIDVLTNGARVHVYQTKMFNGAQWGRIDDTDSRWACLNYVTLDGNQEIKNPESSSASKLGQGMIYNCTPGVNIRASATPFSNFLGIIPVGTVVELLEETETEGNAWYRTAKGWICGIYVKKVDLPAPGTPGAPGSPIAPGTMKTGIVSGNMDVNVRNLPGVVGTAVLTTLKPGTGIKILEQGSVGPDIWYRIEQGWIAGKYVQLGDANVGGTIGTTTLPGGQYVTGTVIEKGVPIRAGAGEAYKKVGDAVYGSTLTFIETRMVDGVAYGRCDKGWINLKFISMNGTGITGTGTMGTVVKCNHSIFVRSAANGTHISNLRLGSRIELLEVVDLGNNNQWARTPLGWVSMLYVSADGPIVPPTTPSTPTTPSETKPDKPKPADMGIPFVMDGTAAKGAYLRIVPGVMGDYDAELTQDTAVKIQKVENVGDTVWGLVDGGWVDLEQVTLSNYAVPNQAQIIWADHNTNTTKGSLNKNTVVSIVKLYLDSARKIWGLVKDQTNVELGWIELSDVTKLENFNSGFLAKGIAPAGTIVYADVDLESEKIGDPFAADTPVSITKLDKDTSGNLWAHVGIGWTPLQPINCAHDYTVSATAAVAWAEVDALTPAAIVNQGEIRTISEIRLNSKNKAMGLCGTSWFELSALTAQ